MIDRLPLPAIDGSDRGPLDLEGWTGRDIDLRISVDAATVKGARLKDVASYILVRRGRFETGLLRAFAYGGTVKSRILAVSAPTGVDIKLQAGFDKVNLGQAAADMPQLVRLTGTGGFQLSLDGAGRSFDELLGSFTGKAGLNLRQGELAGASLPELLRRAERGPLPLARDWRQGRTAFDSLSANAGIASGMLVLTDAQMTGTSYRLALTGSALLRTRELDMSAVLLGPAGQNRLSFAIKGPVESPFLAPDSEAQLDPAAATGIAPVRTGR
jgi:uncharacterized protein involved in outer membrane biogenesis